MKELKVGDKVLVPMVIISKRDGGDFPYTIGYDTARINMSEKRVAELQTLANGDKTYEDGMADAWELAKKIICNIGHAGLSASELMQIFGYNNFDDVFVNYTSQEAAAKIAEWEDGKVIHVGDVVQNKNTGVKGLITVKDGEKDFHILFEDGRNGRYLNHKDSLKKTGRTIDIKALLEQIGGVE